MVATTEVNGTAGPIIPVGSAQSSLPAPDLAGLDTQTRKIGLIYPPPDIRAIADKTALYVFKNGPDFERRVRANEAENTKFSFLKPGDPYHAYYQHKLAEHAAPAAEEEAPAAAGAATATPAAAPAAAPAPTPAAPSVLAPTQPLAAPAEEVYTVHVPEGLTPLDLDVIKLTAAAVARNGKKFLTELASREHASPQFNFLKPTHSLFAFFTALCDAYSAVLMPPKGLAAELAADAGSRARVLERALRRLEWERARDSAARAAGDAEEADRAAMQSIDWHDFVVVETIDFFEDETGALPPPMLLRDVVRLTRAGQLAEAEAAQAEAAAAGGAAAVDEQALPMDAEERALVAQAAGAAAGGGEAGAAATPGGDDGAASDVDMEESEEEAEVRIVRDYVRVDPRAGRADPTGYVTSPLTGELVAVGDMAEHMRVSLIDPRWREQRNVMLSRIKETTRASDDEISRNLASLAATLPDVFGSSQEEVSAAVGRAVEADRAAAAAAGAAGAGAAPPSLQPPAPGAAAHAYDPQGAHLGLEAGSSGDAALPPPPKGMSAWPPGFPRPPLVPQAVPVPVPVPAVPAPSTLPPQEAVLETVDVAAPLPAGAADAAAPVPADPSGGPTPSAADGAAEPAPGPASMTGPCEGEEGPAPGSPPAPKVYPKGMAPPAAPGTAAAAIFAVPPRASVARPSPAPLPPPGAGIAPTPAPGMVLPGSSFPAPLPVTLAPPLPGSTSDGVAEGGHPPPLPEGEPPAKRAKIDMLEPEEEWLETHPGQCEILVACAAVEGHETLTGQTVPVHAPSLGLTVLAFKDLLVPALAIPANKQRLSAEGLGFLRDELSLAHYNVAPGDTLQLSIKERGRRRK